MSIYDLFMECGIGFQQSILSIFLGEIQKIKITPNKRQEKLTNLEQVTFQSVFLLKIYNCFAFCADPIIRTYLLYLTKFWRNLDFLQKTGQNINIQDSVSIFSCLNQLKFAQQHKNQPKQVQNFAKDLINPLRLAKGLIFVAKVGQFRQISSHCSRTWMPITTPWTKSNDASSSTSPSGNSATASRARSSASLGHPASVKRALESQSPTHSDESFTGRLAHF